jgi:hypothetical protein
MSDYNGILDYSGWVEIHLEENLNGFNGRKQFFREIEPYISDFNRYTYRMILYQPMNFADKYFISGVHNHAGTYFDDLLSLLKVIGEKAPLSYGLVYVLFAEHPVYWNEYRVFRLAKGIITEHEDILLSPCNPTVEN